MRSNTLTKPVAVGIDGSQAAMIAAVWAADEAIARDVPLRLVYVNSPDSALPGNAYRAGIAELALRVAAKAVADLEKPVKVETVLLTGPPRRDFAAKALIRESRHASMLALGPVGLGRMAATVLGATATTVTQRAKCPVAIVSRPAPSGQAVAVVVDPSEDPTAASSPAGASAAAR